MSYFVNGVEVSSFKCGHGCYVTVDRQHFDCQFCRNNPRDRKVFDVEIAGGKQDLRFTLADCHPSPEKQAWIEQIYPFDGYQPVFNCFALGQSKLKKFFVFRGQGVHHPDFGDGVVKSELSLNEVVVQFPDRVETVKRSDLSRIKYPAGDVARSKELDRQIKYHRIRRDVIPTEDLESNYNAEETRLFYKFEPLIAWEINSGRYRSFRKSIGKDLRGYASVSLLNAIRAKGAELEGSYARIAIRNGIRNGLLNEIHPAVGGNDLAFEFVADPSSHEKYSKFEREIAVLKILKRIPVMEAKVVYLRYLGQRTVRNVARILGMGRTQVSTLELRGLERLRHLGISPKHF